MNVSSGSGRNRRTGSTVRTRSGKTMKVNQTLSNSRKARKAERAAQKAAYLSTLPKNRFKRTLYRMHPKRVAKYWFSREGGLMALKIVGITIVICFFFTIGIFAYFRKDLPQLKNINGENLGGSISYYDSTGKTLLWQDYGGVQRIPVQSNQISPYMKEATVAIEDKNFYKEGAFDVRGILRAAVHDAKSSNGVVEGGSTITQQLVKLNEGWTDDRTITRKVKELILAVEIEREYTKDQILTGYLNVAPYGGIEYGVQSAAEDYFHTAAVNLTLAQASMLAAIPQSPSYYSPYGSTQFNSAAGNTFSASALITRQHYILLQMQEQGYINKTQEATAEKVNVLSEVQPLESKYQNIQDPYFVLAAKQQLENQFGTSFVDRGGLKVITTLNLGLQNYANEDVANNAPAVAAVRGDEEAMVAEDVKTGQVVAQVGGEDFNNPTYGQIDYADTNISPGSSFKPFLYAALIQNNTNAGAGSVLYDVQQPLPGYPCTDKSEPTTTSAGGNCLFDDNFVYPGPETIRYALAGSRNVPAVKASYEVDPTDTSSDYYVKSIDSWITLANEAIGVKNAYACYQQNVDLETATTAQQTQCYGSAALGSGDVALDKEVNGDVTLARLGQEIPQTYILNITDSSDKTVYQWQQPKSTQVYKADTAYIINSILDDPKASYLQPYQKFQNYNGWDIAVKTGTENQEYNGVMTAWSTQYAVIGFAGYHTLDQPLEEGHFEDITEPITRTWMEQALNALHIKPVNWVQPSDVKSIAGFVQRVSTGYGAEVPGPTDDLYPSWYVGNNTSSASEKVDKVSGLLATSCTPADAVEYQSGSDSANEFSIDTFYPTTVANEHALDGTAVATATDNIHKCSDSPPTVSLSAPATCATSCVISATVTQGTHALNDPQYPQDPGNVSFTLSGKVIKAINVSTSPSTVSFTYTPTDTGSGTLTATVTDSVLDQGTSSTTLNYSAPAAVLTLTQPTSGQTFTGNFSASWSGGTGPYTAYLQSAGGTAEQNSTCTSISGSSSGTSCTVTLPTTASSVNYTFYIEDSTNAQTTPITISGQE
jgi:membrane peptidoglycan carboxypeptidase